MWDKTTSGGVYYVRKGAMQNALMDALRLFSINSRLREGRNYNPLRYRPCHT